MSLDAFTTYLSLEKNYSAHTVKAYRSDIESFSAYCIETGGNGEIDSLQYPEIRNWIVYLVESGLSNRTVNRKVASLKAYYKFLLKTGLIRSNPLAGHKALKMPKKVELPFSEIEMKAIMEEISFDTDFEGRRDKLLIELLYTTGIRRAELINLQLGDLDLEQRTIRVLGKRNKERIVPLLEGTAGLFRDYLTARQELAVPGEEQSVFLSKSGIKIYETLVYRIINGYFSKVSTKVKRSPHILRHTFATHLLNKGADLNAVKELLGHSSLASTQVYTHTSIAELKKVHTAAHPRSRD